MLLKVYPGDAQVDFIRDGVVFAVSEKASEAEGRPSMDTGCGLGARQLAAGLITDVRTPQPAYRCSFWFLCREGEQLGISLLKAQARFLTFLKTSSFRAFDYLWCAGSADCSQLVATAF